MSLRVSHVFPAQTQKKYFATVGRKIAKTFWGYNTAVTESIKRQGWVETCPRTAAGHVRFNW